MSQKGCRELKGLGTGSADYRFSLHLNSVQLIEVTKKTAQLLFLLFVNVVYILITVVVLVLLRIRMLILLSLLLHYRLIYSCLLWKNIATTKHSVDTECVQCTSLSSQVMVPLASQNDLVMVNIYACFQTPYIRSIRKKVTFVSRLQITEITIELFFFFCNF